MVLPNKHVLGWSDLRTDVYYVDSNSNYMDGLKELQMESNYQKQTGYGNATNKESK